MKTCKILNAVQGFRLTTFGSACYSAIDCTEENRYHVKSPSPIALNSL